MIGRIVIDNVRRRTTTGEYRAKAVIGEQVRVPADVYRDGHDLLGARVRWRPAGDRKWLDTVMRPVVNDQWEAIIEPDGLGLHEVVVEAWTDRYATWAHDVQVKREAGQAIEVELEEGALLLEAWSRRLSKAERTLLRETAAGLRDGGRAVDERLAAGLDPAVAQVLDGVPDPTDRTASRRQQLWVDRERALVGAWYELFPRSEGGLRPAAARRLPAIAAMGFDVVYLPPVHPIGRSFRKGRNNTLTPEPGDPGSPWAIGSAEGGHTALDPELGTF